MVACTPAVPPYPASTYITDITFDMATLRTEAPGSDNWAITWAEDGHQYTTWGDGGGFDGTDDEGRVSLGVGRVEGGIDDYTGHNVWGGQHAENPRQFNGKSVGILSIDSTLYLWRSGVASEKSAFALQELYKSTDHGASWVFTGVRFALDQFPNGRGLFALTFCQFGRGYQGARDEYVYFYASEVRNNEIWDVQKPGEIALIRVGKNDMADRSKYEFWAGLDEAGTSKWSTSIGDRKPVFEDVDNGVMRTSVSYNAGLGRYLLTTQQVSRHEGGGGYIGIYEAPEPWGPWRTVLFANAWSIGAHGKLQHGSKTVFWNFSNKWLSADGRRFVMVYTGPGADEWGTVKGQFTVSSPGRPPVVQQ